MEPAFDPEGQTLRSKRIAVFVFLDRLVLDFCFFLFGLLIFESWRLDSRKKKGVAFKKKAKREGGRKNGKKTNAATG